ncbi:AfsR/SARP family transcriptional regulator [Streptomyces globosus]|uniref:AfsR/SARP family transcriptional regulator n=1 Tax=Streptomyces globosus TaxID=68209 RepID=UPI0013B401DF|nr:BTAD domain-containing putative transcriptional regulator [Streptomyces globosus]
MSDPFVLRFSLLGPVQAARGGVDVPLGPPQQRLVLAILLVRRPGVAGLDELIDGIWGEAGPRTAAGTVRSYVYRLRRVLGPCLVTEGGGYALDVPDGAVDLADFEAEAARGRELVAAGDPDAGARLLEAALARWRGVPLAGLPGPFARIQRERLAELRLSVLLERVEADLARGLHARLVPELGALCAEYPLNGRLRTLRAETLARAGRADEAGAAPPGEGGRPARVEAGRVAAPSRPAPARAEGPAAGAARERPAADGVLAGTPARPTAPAAGILPAAEEPVRSDAAGTAAAVAPGPGTEHPAAAAHAGPAQAPQTRPAAAQSGLHPPATSTGRHLRAAAPPLPAPAQLPYVAVDFTGRETATRRLVEALTPASGAPAADAGGPPAVVVSAVGGIGGVGKTTLALHAAHRLRAHFRDGQLYANLRGVREDPAEPGAVLAAFLRALGVADSAIPEGVEERAGLYRSRVADKRMLLVLDDARDVRQIEPLLPGSSACAVVVTSRSTLAGLPAALRLRLDVLPAGDAVRLLGRIVGRERIEAEPAEAAALAALCGGLPLALRIAGSRLATRPGWSLAAFRDLLEGRRAPFSAEAGGEDGVEACFRLSYELLDAAEARLFRLLALPEQEDADVADAAALAGIDPAHAEELLERMTELGLLESPAPQRYRFHDLLRAFARARSAEEDGPGGGAEALVRLVDHHLASARNAYAVERPGHPVPGMLHPTRSPGTRMQVPGEAHRVFTGRHQSVLAVAVQTVRADPSAVDLVADLVLALDPVLDGTFLWAALIEPARAVLKAARGQGRRRAAGRLGYMLGGGLYQLGHTDEAESVLAAAAADAQTSGDEAVLTEIRTCQALVWYARGDLERALELHGQAVAVGERCGSRWGAENARACSAHTLSSLGRLAEADAAARRSLASARADGDAYRLSYTLYVLGGILRQSGRPEEAIAYLREGAALSGQAGYATIELFSRWEVSYCHLAAGRHREAVESGERVAEVSREKGWALAEARALQVVGTALAGLGDREGARERLERAAGIFDRLRPAEAAQVRELLAGL